jgi:hypothetical protein
MSEHKPPTWQVVEAHLATPPDSVQRQALLNLKALLEVKLKATQLDLESRKVRLARLRNGGGV